MLITMVDNLTKIKQGLQYPKKFIEGRLENPQKTLSDIKVGEGGVVLVNGKKTAVYKQNDNSMIALSPVCTHLACIVNWNTNDKTWDCPCHGSRFEKDGKVKQGPAKKALQKI